MKRKFLVTFIVAMFLLFCVSMKNVLATGSCGCETKELSQSGNYKLVDCVVIKSDCGSGTSATCKGQTASGQNGLMGLECISGVINCECKAPAPTNPDTFKEITPTPVSIPDYPIKDALNRPVSGLLSGYVGKNLKLGVLIGNILTYVYVIAGISLLLVLILGGISLMTAAGSPEKIKSGYGKIVNALIGFLIVFVSYFVVQIVEVVLGVKIL